MTTTTTSFKIRKPAQRAGQEDHIRRLTLPSNEVSLEALRERARVLFSLPDDRVWFFKYKDEDGDAITLTEPEELSDLLLWHAAQDNAAVVRLTLFVEPPARNPDLPSWVNGWPSVFAEIINPPEPQPAEEPTYGALCDKTDVSLRVGEGWWHRPGSNVDLSHAAWEELSETERSQFVFVSDAKDLGEDAPRYRLAGRCGRFRGRCRGGRRSRVACPFKAARSCTKKSGGCPRSANSSAAEANANKKAPAAPFDLPTHVAWCDDTGAPLFVGAGWWHESGTNHDLSQAAFDARQQAGQPVQNYTLVNSVEDLGADKDRYDQAKHLLGEGGKQLLQNVLGQFFPGGAPWQPQSPQDAQQPAETQDDATEQTPAEHPQEATEPTHKVEVLFGPSVPLGTSVVPGARLMPVWEIRNAGAEGLWTDVRLKPAAGNPLQVAQEGFEVPLLAADESGIVTVELTVPTHLAGQRVVAEFVFVNGSGDVFGEPLRLDLDVQALELNASTDSDEWELAEVENEGELLGMLAAMGFGDEALAKSAIRQAKGDVNQAALALLRQAAK